MARLADGDRSVFGRVFELLWSPVQRLCLSLVKNGADAATPRKEAMQKILGALRLRPRAAAMPWAWRSRAGVQDLRASGSPTRNRREQYAPNPAGPDASGEETGRPAHLTCSNTFDTPH
jgi:RNA polymerase sigma-70 factor (ECF subfamily)